MNTFMARKENTRRGWTVYDAKDKVLGRAATAIADILRGKNRPTFTPNVDTGDFVIVTNAAHIKLTGKKWQKKIYYHHTGYMGGLKEITAEKLMVKHPEQMLEIAVKGMLPKNFSTKKFMRKLKIYPGAAHPHAAQTTKEVKS